MKGNCKFHNHAWLSSSSWLLFSHCRRHFFPCGRVGNTQLWLDTGYKLQWFVKNLATFIIGKKCSKWVPLTRAILNSQFSWCFCNTHNSYAFKCAHTARLRDVYECLFKHNFYYFSWYIWIQVYVFSVSQLFCVRIVLPWLVGQYNKVTPLYMQHENTMWLWNPFPETQDGYTIIWLSCDNDECRQNITCPPVLFFLWILFGIVTRSKYYMASHKLHVKQININFLFPKFLLRVFFPPHFLLFSTFVWTWPCIYTKTQDQNNLN
jgi:hypothetical protein